MYQQLDLQKMNNGDTCITLRNAATRFVLALALLMAAQPLPVVAQPGPSVTWQQCLQQGSGTITIQVFDITARDAQGNPTSVELDLMAAFVRFVRQQYGVRLAVQNYSTADFSDYYNRMVNAPPGYFIVGPLSVTEERKKYNAFSPTYMPDIQVVVSSPQVPLANTVQEFKQHFSGLRAVVLPKSTFETNILALKKQYLPDLKIEYEPSGMHELQRISNEGGLFGYIELPVYLYALKTGLRIKRHNVFQVRGIGYAIAFAKGSDWQQPINAFFASPDFKPLMNILIQKHLGQDVKDLLYELGRDDSTRLRGLVQLQNAESKLHLLELEQQSLIITRNQLQKQLLWGALGVAMLMATVLYLSFRSIRKRNQLLADKNREIMAQQEELQAAQAQLILAEKKASLGKLMANMSHELNSPLGAIRAHTQVLQARAHQLQTVAAFVRNLSAADFAFFQQLLQYENAPDAELSTKEARRLRTNLENALATQGLAGVEEAAQLLLQLGITDAATGIAALQRPGGMQLLQHAAIFKQLQFGLQNIATSVERTRKVLYALRSFNLEAPKKTDKPLNLAHELEAEVQRQAPRLSAIRFEKHTDPALPVLIAPEDAQQLFGHLLQNAVQAVAGTAQPAVSLSATQAGGMVQVTVADNGPGLAPHVQEHLFEPFVTTRPVGEGSGLGLFICKRIADMHGGTLQVSRQNGYTAFTVQLPAAA
jgi:signal transduction histidine kinase